MFSAYPTVYCLSHSSVLQGSARRGRDRWEASMKGIKT